MLVLNIDGSAHCATADCHRIAIVFVSGSLLSLPDCLLFSLPGFFINMKLFLISILLMFAVDVMAGTNGEEHGNVNTPCVDRGNQVLNPSDKCI